MFENFPYTDMHQLNLDWIIKIAKDFLDQYTHIQQLIEDGEQSLQDLTSDGLNQLQEKAEHLEELLQAWYDTHSGDIADQLAGAIEDLNTWYTQHEGYLDSYVAESIQTIQTRTDTIIEQIPQEYTQISDSVNTNKTFLGFKWTLNKYINASTGTAYPATGDERLCTEQYIPIIPGSTLTVKLETGHPSVAGVAFYSIRSAAGYLQSDSLINVNTTGDTYTVTVPDTAHFARFSGRTNISNMIDYSASPLLSYMEEHDNDFLEQQVCYISPSGSGNASGTRADPMNTITNAIAKGYRNICLLRGRYDTTYTQAQVIENKNNIHIFADCVGDYENRAVLNNLIRISKTNTAYENGHYRQVFSSAPQSWTNVFINHTAQPTIDIGSGRTSPSCGLWILHDDPKDDYYLNCVLSVDDLTDNSFYWDGDYIYYKISDFEAMTELGANAATSYALLINNCNNVIIDDIDMIGGTYASASIKHCSNVVINNCSFSHSIRSDGVQTDYSNTIFNNCKAYKNRNDGFNCHYQGKTVYNGCTANYNYDDGESSHENCEVIVNGGEYAYNTKGGHSPVHNVKFSANGTYSHHNGYGLYMDSTQSYDDQPNAIIVSSAFIHNGTDLLVNNNSTAEMVMSQFNTRTGTGTIITE